MEAKQELDTKKKKKCYNEKRLVTNKKDQHT